MAFSLPDLPYGRDALAPHISEETLNFHHGKHHAAYVNNLNKLVEGTDLDGKSIEDTITAVAGNAEKAGVFNNAAQVWNHTFFWNGLSPKPTTPSKAVTDALVKAFGGLEDFKKQFTESAIGNFGSGWTWLVKDADGSLAIVNTANAGNPMTDGKTPLLTCDVWEHAYYVDYRNARPTYLEHYWALVNWEFVEKNLG